MNNLFARMIVLVACMIFLFGSVSYAGDDPELEVDTVAPPAFVSALDEGVEMPAGTTLSAADRAILSRITTEDFQLLMDGGDPYDIITVSGESLDSYIDGLPMSFGSNSEDLVYVPIDPCRVIDTGAAGGSFSAGETRSYVLGGKSDFTSYGGSNGACSLPGSEGLLFTSERVRAWALNIVAAAPTGGGNFVAWPANQAEPTASTLNFQQLSPNLNVANGVIVKNCDDIGGISDPLCPTGDVSVKANFSGARLVVDVAGYFTRGSVESVKSWMNSATQTTDVDLIDGACYNLGSCGRSFVIIGTPVPAGKIVVQGSANIDMTQGSGYAYRYLGLTDVDTTTCLTGDSPNGATVETSWSGSLVDKQINVQGVFPIAAGATKTIYLNAQAAGDFSAAHVNASSIICTFIPD